MKLISKFGVGLIATLFITTHINISYGSDPILDLPVSSVTPGATNPAVTQSNIQKTICVSGYTATIRPTSSYTTKLKMQQLKSSPYSRYGSTSTSLFEEDHLIPLELGGNPTSPLNLWPEPWNDAYGAHKKDVLENLLHKLVCSGSLDLRTAQSAIATNWYSAYTAYVLKETPSTTPTPASSSISSSSKPQPATTSSGASTILGSPSPSTTTTSSPRPSGSTGRCKDGTYSYASTHRGMCSGHGGVLEFYS